MDAGKSGREMGGSAADRPVTHRQAGTSRADPVAENGIGGRSESDDAVVHFAVDSGEPGDVTLDTGDQRFSCHKRVLCQHSLYFKAMFESGMKESRSKRVHLGDVDSKHLQCLLHYFYTGDLDVTELNVRGVAEVSSRLQVSGALDQCCHLLLTVIEDDLCLSLMRLANLLMLTEVYDQSRRHALWHFRTVSKTEDFFLVSSAQLIDYLQDPHLNMESEVDVFTATAEWYSTQEKPCDVTDLTGFFGRVVNFHLMTDEEVASLMHLPVVQKDKALKSFVTSLSEDVITSLRTEVTRCSFLVLMF